MPEANDQNYYHLIYKFEKLHLERAQGQENQKYPILELLKKPGLLIMLIGHKVLTWYFSQKKQKISASKDRAEVIAAPLDV